MVEPVPEFVILSAPSPASTVELAPEFVILSLPSSPLTVELAPLLLIVSLPFPPLIMTFSALLMMLSFPAEPLIVEFLALFVIFESVLFEFRVMYSEFPSTTTLTTFVLLTVALSILIMQFFADLIVRVFVVTPFFVDFVTA